MKRACSYAISVCLLMALLTGCGGTSAATSEADSTSETPAVESLTAETESGTSESAEAEPAPYTNPDTNAYYGSSDELPVELTDDVIIPISYCDLRIPAGYANTFVADITEEDNGGSCTISGKTDLGDIFLFTLYFSEDERGKVIGTLNYDDGTSLIVSEEDLDFSGNENLSDDLKQTLELEREQFKTILYDQLCENAEFTPEG